MATAEITTESAHEAHDDRVAHHFDSAQQQFDAGKLGMWLFLVNEVLFFSGLFVAYAVYRANHPEVFVNAHKYLNTTLGAVNTIVLLISSLTMAWAVRAAQLNQKKTLVGLLATTLACASLFLGIKAVEYSHKWDKGLLWAGAYEGELAHPLSTGEIERRADHTDVKGDHSSWLSKSLLALALPFGFGGLASVVAYLMARVGHRKSAARFWFYITGVAAAFFVGVAFGQVVESFSTRGHENTLVSHSEPHPNDELHVRSALEPSVAAVSAEVLADRQKFTGVFFSIYYAMTGVHALHILVGMGVIAWLLWRAIKQDFDEEYFGPVDFVALYWHLVDLVWVYLFPLLYLIR